MQASTPVNISRLSQELKHHPDRKFVASLLSGLQSGFHTGFSDLPRDSFICKNLQSAVKDPSSVSALISTELQKGFLLGPFPDIPFQHYRINPVGLAEHKYSKKKRLIVDMSAPHNDSHNPSLNSLIDKESYSLQYVRIDDAIRLIKERGKGCLLIKTDISDAFKLIPIAPDLWPFHGIGWQGQFYFYHRLVFGSRSSPKIFDYLSQAICWIAQNNYDIQDVLHLLDDFLVVTPKHAKASATKVTFLDLFQSLGVPTAPHKTDGPTTCLEYLGVILDSALMQARLPANKVERIQQILLQFASKRTCTKQELLSLLGHMNFACRVVRPGRSFVSHLISLSTTVQQLHHHVTLSAALRADLRMWSLFLQNWNGVSFFLDENITMAADIHIFTDATPSSFGGFYAHKWFQGHFPPDFYSEQQSMALCELFPIVVAGVLWGHLWSRKRLLFYCDNEATVEIISKGRSKVPSIMKLMRKLTFTAAQLNFTVHAKHIPGHTNCTADALSRFQMTRFRQLAPQADPLPTPCPPLQDLMMD